MVPVGDLGSFNNSISPFDAHYRVVVPEHKYLPA